MSALYPWVVLKFGGNSVADLTCWKTIASIIQQHLDNNKRPLVVCSALSGMTNKLTELTDAQLPSERQRILEHILNAYRTLADELSVDFNATCGFQINTLSTLATTEKKDSALRATLLAFGEILLTQIGQAYLQKFHFPATWYDARTLLKANSTSQFQYLAAHCDYETEPAVIKKLNETQTPVAITQGFIASNDREETVLLGRGGSDTSAAYFSAKLKAERCEIWTDVPGVYTANPKEIPKAKPLASLDYDEAQEIASMGAKVLHPYCIPPLKATGIPLFVGYTREPHQLGTTITAAGSHRNTPIKAISTKYPITLIEIETVQMWHQVGFLADVFNCFKKHSLSVDLVSTSETAVTVSLDLNVNSHDSSIVEALLYDLNIFCKATEIKNLALISIIGKNIRTMLHKIGPAFNVFEEQKVYLISQAANNLNLSVVIDQDLVIKLAQKLHAVLIET